MNKRGEKPEKLNESVSDTPQKTNGFVEIVGQDSLTRFDKAKKRKKKKKRPADEKKSVEGASKPAPQSEKGPNRPPKRKDEKGDRPRHHERPKKEKPE